MPINGTRNLGIPAGVNFPSTLRVDEIPNGFAADVVVHQGKPYVWNGISYTPQAPVRTSFKRFISVGDSITAEAPSGGWPQYFSLLSNGEYICTYNAAVAGWTLATMDAQFGSIPSWVKADIVMVQGGTNSPGVTTANKDALQSLVAKIYARGAIPQIHACPPQLNMNNIADWNVWMANYCAKNGIEFVDKWSGIADPATGGILATYKRDETHPNPVGQVAGAQRLLDVLRAKSGSSSQWTYPLQFANTIGGLGFSANPLNTIDTNGDGNGDGWGAPAFQGSQTPTPCTSVATRATAVLPAIGRPQRYQDSFNYASQASLVRHSKDVYGQGFRGGRRIHVVSHLRLNALTQVQPNSVFVGVTFATNGAMSYSNTECKFNAPGISGIHVREFVLPASFSEIYLTWRSWGGDGTTDFEVCNIHCYDLTELGVD